MADPDLPRTLKLLVLSSFATKWLVPRLGGFADLYPAVEISLFHHHEPPDFGSTDFDLAILWSDGEWKGCDCYFLMEELIFPVCSQKLLDGAVERGTSLSLASTVILRTALFSQWPLWLKGANIDRTEPMRTRVFDDGSMMIDAAVEGQGSRSPGAFWPRTRSRPAARACRSGRSRRAHTAITWSSRTTVRFLPRRRVHGLDCKSGARMLAQPPQGAAPGSRRSGRTDRGIEAQMGSSSPGGCHSPGVGRRRASAADPRMMHHHCGAEAISSTAAAPRRKASISPGSLCRRAAGPSMAIRPDCIT